ncbi:MAG: PAS domain S-box protein [Balneolales bacterium]|nr:PAS domain S-box protein [Balneolales bacterium]
MKKGALLFLWSLLCFSTITAQPESVPHYETDVYIAVLANRGTQICLKEWEPTANYLSGQIPNHRFHIVPLPFNDFLEEVLSSERNISYFSANPSFYAFLEFKGEGRRLVTKQMAGNPHPQTLFGGVIFTRTDQTRISDLADLKGTRFAAVDSLSLGGWHAALREFIQAGLNPERDFASVIFKGTHDAVVEAVLSGAADAGTVRSTQLERMSEENLLDLDQIKILHSLQERYPDYHHLLSTALYPEWPFAATSSANDELSKKITIALLGMPNDHPAARSLGVAGWTVAEMYDEVHELLRIISLPPYVDEGITLRATVKTFWPWLIAISALIILALGFAIIAAVLNIRARKMATLLGNSLQQFKTLFEDSPVSMIIHDKNTGEIIDANPKAIENYQVNSISQLKSSVLWTEEAPYNKEEALRLIHRAAKDGKQQFEWKSTTPKGQEKWEIVTLKPIVYKGIKQVLAVTVNITEQKEAELELKKLSTAVTQSPASIIITNTKGDIEYVNPKFTELTGYTLHEAIGRNPKILKSGAQSDTFYKDLWETITTGKIWKGELYNLNKNGEFYWEDATISPVLNDDGEIINFLAVKEDITEKKRAEAELERFKQISDSGLHGSVIADLDGNLIYVNRFYANIHGYEPNELSGQHVSVFHSKDQLPDIERLFNQLKAEGKFESVLLWHVHRDGRTFPMLMTGLFVQNEKNKSGYLAATAIDMTDFLKTKKQLDESRKQLNMISDNMPRGFVYQLNTGIDGSKLEFTYVSAGIKEMFGVSQEEVMQDPMAMYGKYVDDDIIGFREKETLALKNLTTFEGEIRFYDPHGNIRWLLASSTPRKNIEGEVVWDGIALDVTELKESQQQIQESEQKFRIVSENTYHWEFWEREDGSFIYNSPSCERITGYTIEEFEKEPKLLEQILHPDDLEHYREHRTRSWSQHGPDYCSFRLYNKKGSLREIEHVCKPAYDRNGTFIGIRGTNIDVTEKKAIERKLIESEKRFREIFEVLPAISVQGYDEDRKVIYWNKASEALYGYTKEEVSGHRLEELIIPDNMKDEVVSKIQNWIDKGGKIPSSEITLQKKDGAKVYVYSNHVMLENQNGKKELFCIDINLTDLKVAESKLKESELYHRSLVQTIPDLIFVISGDGTFLDYKSSDKNKLLLDPTEFLNKKIKDLFPSEVCQKQMDAIQKSLSTNKTVEFDYSLTIDGVIHFFNAKTTGFGKDRVITTVRDITDYQFNLQRIQELLDTEGRQNRSLRDFTYIVSHNLRVHTANMLGLLMFLEDEEPELFENEMIRLIKSSTNKLEETIQDLNDVLSIRSGDQLDFERVSVYDAITTIITDKIELAREYAVEIDTDIDPDLRLVTDRAYFESVFSALLSNGIKYSSTDRDSIVTITAKSEDNHIKILVIDNGVGINLGQHGNSIFGMYKKFHNHNSKGLSLYMAKNQIEAMKGQIEISSQAGEGTKVTVILPLNPN